MKLIPSHTEKQPLSDSGNGEITADSTPVYDTPFWPFDEAWDCRDWITWHKKLKAKIGQEKANEKFLNAWADQNWFEWNYSFCKYRSDFADYLKKQGIEADNILSESVKTGQDVVDNSSDIIKNVSDGLEGISAGLGNLTLGKVLFIGGAIGAGYLFGPTLQDKIQDWTK